MTFNLDPEDVAHRLDLDGEIVGVEWDAGSHTIRFVTRPHDVDSGVR